MRILIVTPAKRGSTSGNRITAQRWARILRSLQHRVLIAESYEHGAYDCLIALHAGKSARSVSNCRKGCPTCAVILAMTGTDLHQSVGGSSVIEATLRQSDRIVILEPYSKRKLKKSFRDKTRVVLQSSVSVTHRPAKLKRYFEVSVLGHLRPVKDPFLTALAARELPDQSRVRVVHFGAALSSEMEKKAKSETANNPRYRWFGSVSHGEAQRRLARSHVTVLSSLAEGGPALFSEAIVNDVPILATRIDASIGLLGKNYPGLFDVGNTGQLADLIGRAESDKAFYRSLVAAGKKLKPKFALSAEIASWKALLNEIQA